MADHSPTNAVVYVDVDGVLNPEQRDRPGFTTHQLAPEGFTYEVALNPDHGTFLLELARDTGATLAWATTWTYHANDLIAPRVGLPGTLPWVDCPPQPRWGLRVSMAAWKAQRVVEHAAGRPFVWFEDEPDAAQQVLLLSRVKDVGPHLVVRVRPHRGLGPEHITKARKFLSELEHTNA